MYCMLYCGYCLLLDVWNELLTGVSTIIDDCTFCVCVIAWGLLTGRLEEWVWQGSRGKQSQVNLNWTQRHILFAVYLSVVLPVSHIHFVYCTSLVFWEHLCKAFATKKNNRSSQGLSVELSVVPSSESDWQMWDILLIYNIYMPSFKPWGTKGF